MEIKGIKYIAPCFDGSGYGQASRGYILALNKLGVPITLAPVSFEQKRPPLGKDGEVLSSLVSRDIDYNVVLIHTTPEFWQQHHEYDKTNVGYTIFETTKLHPDWPNYINNNVDKVLTGSTWGIDTFKNSGVTIPIGVVPHGIETSEFEGIKPYNIAGVNEDTFVFYDIFQFMERKNPVGLIKAYWYAFRNKENVALVLKTYRSSYDDKEKDVIRETLKRLKSVAPLPTEHAKVYLILDILSREEILGLHARGDCFVSLNRGEGFGLNGFTAGACGDPVIITGFGGATEYAEEDNSYLVDYQLVPVTGMPWSPWYLLDQLWSEPNVIHGAELMRHVYNNQEEAKEKGKKLQQLIKTDFSWEVVGKKMVNEIKEL